MTSEREVDTGHDPDDREMSFLDHLEELRHHLIRAMLGLLFGIMLCGYFSEWIVNEVILKPAKVTTPPLDLINTVPYGQITFYMVVVVVGGIIVSSPWILFQVWKFIQPALLPREQHYISGIVVSTTFCFLGGVSFAYFIMLPYMLQFFASFGTAGITNMFSVSEYMSFVLQLILISGLIFELPVVSYFLARLGLLTPPFMRHYRKHAIVVILIVAAIVTPTTDPFTMAIFALPMLVLYEISIGIAKIAQRKRAASASGNIAANEEYL